METFNVYSDPKKTFYAMLEDIKSAKKSIFLETYIYDNDEIGRKFREALIRKAKQKIRIKLLIDAWGSTVEKTFFKELVDFGAEVRFFREIKYLIRFFSKNHERNHRKLLIIDNNITYIGSMNITKHCFGWRELVVRIKGDIANDFTRSFYKSWDMYGEFDKKRIQTIIHEEYEIIHDIPSFIQRATEKRLYKLIKKAHKEILIETPYFVPSLNLINAFGRAVKRGVKITLLIPYRSDVRIVDIVRNSYLGRIYKRGVDIRYYKEKTMHSKLLLVDNSFFMLGSSNIDYRSFLHNFEINFIGKNPNMIKELRKFFNSGLANSVAFDYEQWKDRSSIGKIVELILGIVRGYM